MGNILSLYIVLLAESASSLWGLTPNELLGVTSAVTGIAMLLSVLPGGLLADRWSLKGTLFIGVAMGGLGLAALVLSPSLPGVGAGLFFWGLFQGFSRPVAEAVLANSTPNGNRSRIYARAHLLDNLGMGIGPLLNILLFLLLGDRWDLGILRVVIAMGLAFSFLSLIIILFLDENHSLGEESEAPGAPLNQTSGERSSRGLAQYIPHVFLAASFIIGFGAGMTVKFFPVFFRAIYGLQPIAVQLIMGIGLLTTALFTLLAQRLSRFIGRPLTILVVQGFSISALVWLAFYPAIWLLVPLFVLRGALMNAANPLSRSIVMDHVPKKNRGVWSGLQTVAFGLFWNASAMAGGFLIGEDNFRLCFLITAGIYVLGSSLMIPMVPVIMKEPS